jgi:D-alanyl-D-alanine dipeptidase
MGNLTRTTILTVACILVAVSLTANTTVPGDSIQPVRASEAAGDFVDVSEIIPEVIIDLKYATPDNVFGQVLYATDECLLRREVAVALARVQKKLRALGLQLVIWDGYRPLSVQKKMWQQVPDERYVANPDKGSRHNRGAAVDVTLADSTGSLLSMPTGYDDFSEKAHRGCSTVDTEAAGNAVRLERVMHSEGFTGLPTEWWHFDYKGWEDYPITDKAPGNIREDNKAGK